VDDGLGLRGDWRSLAFGDLSFGFIGLVRFGL